MIQDEIDLITTDGNLDCTIFITNEKEYPYVIFYMDAPGIRKELKEMCVRIASHGYNVILPNLFYRVGTEGNYPFSQTKYKKNKVELNKMISIMNSTTNTMISEDTKYILDYISKKKSNKKKIGIIGYCMSGRFVVYCGAKFSDRIAAIASFYGVGIFTNKCDSPHLFANDIDAEMYLAFAEKDVWVPDNVLEKIKSVFSNKKYNARIEIYKNTDHGFAFPSRSTYVKEASEKHWERLLDLFDRNLKITN